ncbi:MAG TPA: apolipoprotein N-acyltransferase [Gammaproteobacteria bacterium]|nr:apolipoprotein N-acyltransferase [Gammaproteobacteria bacterium]
MRTLLALTAGLLLPFAFAPYGAWPVAIVSLAGLFALLRRVSPRTAAWRGWLFGLGAFAHGVSWIQVSIHKFGLPLYSFSVSMTALFVLFMACYPALAAWLARRLPGGEVVRALCIAPAAWTAVEILRGWAWSGFPWLVVGYGQTASPYAGWMPLAGAYGATLAVALSAGALVVVLAELQAARRGEGARAVTLAVGGLALLAPAAAGELLGRVEWTAPDGPPLRIALVQGAVPQTLKWRADYRGPTLDLYARLSEAHWGRDVVIWPETALPAFPDEIAPFLRQLDARARQAGTALLVGMPSGDPRARYFNSVLLLGAGTGRYDKHHLVPFGEYLPFDAYVRPLLDFLSIPMSSFTAGGESQAALVAGPLRFGVSICYEDAYGGEVRKPLPQANVLVNVSDDAWFGDSLAPHQHLEIAQARALETGRPLLRATNTGISAIIDHRGRVLTRSPQFATFVLTGEAQTRRGATPYVRYGSLPVFAACALLCVAALLTLRRR